MELFLDSVNFEEIEEAIKSGTLTGLTTTPTFMFRHGITDTDGAIVKLSGMVPSLHIEALGEDVDEIKRHTDALTQAAHQMATTAYQQSADTGTQSNSADPFQLDAG